MNATQQTNKNTDENTAEYVHVLLKETSLDRLAHIMRDIGTDNLDDAILQASEDYWSFQEIEDAAIEDPELAIENLLRLLEGTKPDQYLEQRARLQGLSVAYPEERKRAEAQQTG